MDDLVKKITQLKDLLKALKKPEMVKGPTLPTIPAIRPPSPPSMAPSKGAAPKIGTGSGPNSKKDPKKVAQQIKDGSMSTKTQKVILKSEWSDNDIEKADQEAQQRLYHIHNGPHRITSQPLSISQIDKRHGGVKKLESNGFRLIPHTPEAPKVIKVDDHRLEPSDPSNI